MIMMAYNAYNILVIAQLKNKARMKESSQATNQPFLHCLGNKNHTSTGDWTTNKRKTEEITIIQSTASSIPAGWPCLCE